MSEPATIAAVAAAVTAATTVGTAASGAFSPGGGDLPDFTGIAKAQQAAQQTGALKGQVRTFSPISRPARRAHQGAARRPSTWCSSISEEGSSNGRRV